jgi:rhomboid family protein
MGIYGRDYMQDEPRRRAPIFRGRSVTVQLIIVNVVVFVLWILSQRSQAFTDFMRDNFMVSAEGVLQHWRIHTLFTSAISQYDPYHILFNMLFLYWFGTDLETLYGRRDYLLLYAMAGVVASIGHVVITLMTGNGAIPALGASGAVMGIVVVFACFYPNRRILFLGFIPIAVKWLAIIYVGIDVAGVVSPSPMDNVAHAAHLGGAITGFCFWKFDLRLFAKFESRARRAPPRKFELRKHHETLDPGDAARVDQLLEKIARFGKDSLTEEERAFLVDASRRFRR